MYHIAVCDDEKRIRDQIVDFLNRYAEEMNEKIQITVFESADRLLVDYPKDVDLIFLDIAMTGVDGMEAAHAIRKFDEKVCIIFITTMYQYAIEGYSVRAFGFICKPVKWQEFHHELSCALNQIRTLQEKNQYIAVKSGRQTVQINIAEIAYCEVQNHSMKIYSNGACGAYRCQMNELEELLRPHGFFRCHASYLVNGSYIHRIERARLILKDGTEIPISQRRKKDFMNELASYIGERI